MRKYLIHFRQQTTDFEYNFELASTVAQVKIFARTWVAGNGFTRIFSDSLFIPFRNGV